MRPNRDGRGRRPCSPHPERKPPVAPLRRREEGQVIGSGQGYDTDGFARSALTAGLILRGRHLFAVWRDWLQVTQNVCFRAPIR
jgi:hypothetical protein